MEKVILNVETRVGAGKKTANALRKKGIIPAVAYRGGKGALNLQVPLRNLEEALHTKAGENVILTLKISGAEKSVKDKTVLIKEIQRDPISEEIIHLDFHEISLTEALKVNVPLASLGESIGVKVDGGILEHVVREVQVECLPTAIPERLEIDVSNLKIGDAVHVKHVSVPEGVKILNDPELIVMIVKPPHIEVPKEEIVEEAQEPELIRKKKEEAEEEEEAKEAEKPAKEQDKEKSKEGKKEEK